MNVKGLADFGLEVVKRYSHPQISKVIISLTNKCNGSCTICNIWKNDGEPKVEWNFADINWLLANNHIMWITLTGGEPSIIKHFKFIVDRCLRSCKMCHFVTNGYATEKIVDGVKYALASAPGSSLLVVNLSVHGSEDCHNRIAGIKDSFSHIISTIDGLKSLNNSRLMIGLHHTVCRDNAGEYKFVEDLARNYGLGLTYSWERHAGYYKNNNGDHSIPEMPKPDFSLNPINIFKNAFLANPARLSGCVAGEYSCSIDYNYNVYPCSWEVRERAPTYNLKDRAYRILPEYFKDDMGRIKKCAGCWIACESYQTLMWRPNRIFAKGWFK